MAEQVDDVLWIGRCLCRDCGHVLNETTPDVKESEKRWTEMVAPLQAGKCPKGCRSTFSDLNLNVEVIWEKVSK